MTDPEPQREAILTALERLLAWPEISRSPQLGRFLDYIVNRTLEGAEGSIKAYSIAVDVFGRPADFDPQADPIVRVQARRLRALLDDYYRGPGVGDVMQIRLPVGRYVPEFSAVPDPGEVNGRSSGEAQAAGAGGGWSFSKSWFTLAFIALVLAIGAFSFATWGPPTLGGPDGLQRPTITVVEFQNLAVEDTGSVQVAGLAIELVTDLEQFGNIAVGYGGSQAAAAAGGRPPDNGPPPSDYVLTGIVLPSDGVVQYSAILTDARTRDVVWNHMVTVPMAQATQPDLLDSVSKSFSLILGSPRGPLHVDARAFLDSDAASQAMPTAYLCRVLFDLYREASTSRDAERARSCFLGLSEDEKESAMVLAATASLLIEHGGPEAGSVADRNRLAAASLERAITLEPVSSFVWEQQARMQVAFGAFDLARSSFSSAVQLNPANVDALSAYAQLLAFSGRLDDAEGMARDAAERSPAPPARYHGVPALLALRDGDFAKAVANAEIYAQADRELGPILAIMAAQRAGDSGVVNRYLPQVLEVATFRAQGVLPRLRKRITDDRLLAAIETALLQAGVPAASLSAPF